MSKTIVVIGWGGIWKRDCIHALENAGYRVLTKGSAADGFVIFDLLQQSIEDHLFRTSVPVFWLVHVFPFEDHPGWKLNNSIIEVLDIAVDPTTYFARFATKVKEKIPLP